MPTATVPAGSRLLRRRRSDRASLATLTCGSASKGTMRLGDTSVRYVNGTPPKNGATFVQSRCRNRWTSQRHKGLPRSDLQVGDGGFLGNAVRQLPSGVLVAQNLSPQVRQLNVARLFR